MKNPAPIFLSTILLTCSLQAMAAGHHYKKVITDQRNHVEFLDNSSRKDFWYRYDGHGRSCYFSYWGNILKKEKDKRNMIPVKNRPVVSYFCSNERSRGVTPVLMFQATYKHKKYLGMWPVKQLSVGYSKASRKYKLLDVNDIKHTILECANWENLGIDPNNGNVYLLNKHSLFVQFWSDYKAGFIRQSYYFSAGLFGADNASFGVTNVTELCSGTKIPGVFTPKLMSGS